jgi:hypothetical protein
MHLVRNPRFRDSVSLHKFIGLRREIGDEERGGGKNVYNDDDVKEGGVEEEVEGQEDDWKSVLNGLVDTYNSPLSITLAVQFTQGRTHNQTQQGTEDPTSHPILHTIPSDTSLPRLKDSLVDLFVGLKGVQGPVGVPRLYVRDEVGGLVALASGMDLRMWMETRGGERNGMGLVCEF